MKLSLQFPQIMTEAREINPGLGNSPGGLNSQTVPTNVLKSNSWCMGEIYWIDCVAVLEVSRRTIIRRAKSMEQRLPWEDDPLIQSSHKGSGYIPLSWNYDDPSHKIIPQEYYIQGYLSSLSLSPIFCRNSPQNWVLSTTLPSSNQQEQANLKLDLVSSF